MNQTPVVLISLFLWFLSCTEMVPYDEFRRTGGNRSIALSSGTTNYELTGDPAATHVVVLLHGGTIPLCIWDPQLQTLRDTGFKVVRYDQYGRGFSERVKAPYSRGLYREQLRELLDSLNILAPVSIIGPSFGGAIAVEFASRYPERVRSLILVSPVLNLFNSESPLVQPLKILKKPLLGEAAYALFFRRAIVSRGKKLVPGGKRSLCASSFVRQFSCKGTGYALLSQIRNDAYGSYREATKKVSSDSLPVLLLRGNNDAEVTPAMIEEVREDLPESTFRELARCGHGASVQCPDQFNRLVIEYLLQH